MSDVPLNGRSKEFVWHQRFGYPNEKSLHTLATQQLVDDFDLSKYKSYMEGKLHKTPFPSQGRT